MLMLLDMHFTGMSSPAQTYLSEQGQCHVQLQISVQHVDGALDHPHSRGQRLQGLAQAPHCHVQATKVELG